MTRARYRFARTLFLLAFAVLAIFPWHTGDSAERQNTPNIVFIMADDKYDISAQWWPKPLKIRDIYRVFGFSSIAGNSWKFG